MVASTVAVYRSGVFSIGTGVWDGVRVGAKLYHAKGDGRPGEHVSHLLGTDHGIHVAREVLHLLLRG